MTIRSASRRAGFAISGWVVFLLVLIVALGVYKASIVWNIQTHTANAAGKKWGFITAPFLWSGIGVLLGWLAYRLSGKSESAGNLVAGLCLAAIATISTIQVVNYWMHGAPSAAQPAQARQPDARDALRSLAEGMKSSPPTVRNATPFQPEARPPGPPPPSSTTPAPTSSPRPESPATTPTRPNRAAARPAPAPRPVASEEDPRVKATLESLSKDLDSAAGALLLQAEPMLDKLDKPPAHVLKTIATRLTELASLRSSAKTLSDRFHGVKDEAEKKLTDAGVDKTEAFSAAIRFSFDVNGMTRAMACDEYARLCDTAQEESEYLRDNIGKWRNDAQGLVTSTDNVVRARAESYRMRIRGGLREREEWAARLRGKER